MSRAVSASRCRTVTLAVGGQAGVLLEQGLAGQQEHEHGERRDRHQVLEEGDHAVVGVLGVVDDQDDGVLVPADPAEEGGPGVEQVLALEGAHRADPEECAETRLEPRPLVGVRDVGVQSQAPAARRGPRRVSRTLAVGPQALQPATDRLRQRVEGDALAVGQAPAAVPAHGGVQPVGVLLELPAEAGLPDAGLAVDDHQRRPAGLLDAVEDLLDQAQLAVPADVRCLESVGALDPADPGDHGPDRPEWYRIGLALHRVAADVDVRDRRGGEQPGRLVDPDLAGSCGGLHPRGGVDGVARDHALLLGADGDRDLAGDDADPHGQVGNGEVGPHRGDPVDQLEPGPDGALGVVLVGGGDTPDRHHGVADELLHRAAVPGDDLAALLEVAGQQLADLLLVTGLREAGEPDEVPEQHAGDRGETPPGRRGCAGAWRHPGRRRRSSRTGRRARPRTGSPAQRATWRLVPHEKQNRGRVGLTRGATRGAGRHRLALPVSSVTALLAQGCSIATPAGTDRGPGAI